MKKESNKGINPFPNFDAMWDYRNPDVTEAKFKEILPLLKNSAEFTYDAGYHAELLTQIARAQGLQEKFDEAHKTLDEAEKLLTENLKTAKVRYLLERGRVYNSSGVSEKAKPLFFEAWEFGTTNKLDLYAIDAAHMIGIVVLPEKQLEWSLKALDLTEKTEDKRAKGWLGPLYNNIGWTYHDLQEYEKALELFEKALKWRQEINDEYSIRIQKWNIARTFRSLGRIDEALEIQLALKKEFEEKQLEQDGYVFEELGELYLIKDNQTEAKKYFKLAFENLSKDNWLQQNEPDRLKRLKDLGD
ncbi:MAG: tetratricopeptide repeat protein [Armatimonadetes bacterium]|nr:tetratricopeptide repeat protein [Armatimonadota bacterium]